MIDDDDAARQEATSKLLQSAKFPAHERLVSLSVELTAPLLNDARPKWALALTARDATSPLRASSLLQKGIKVRCFSGSNHTCT